LFWSGSKVSEGMFLIEMTYEGKKGMGPPST